MKLDQFERLEKLQEKLVSVVLEEADPDNWPGKGKAINEMGSKDRGDRYWCKKNAAATLSLLTKTLSLEHFKKRAVLDDEASNDDDIDLDKDIKRFEDKAVAMLNKYQRR